MTLSAAAPGSKPTAAPTTAPTRTPTRLPTPGPFTATLGKFNGVPARNYSFRVGASQARSGSYSIIMVQECKKYGMKPVCDRTDYCENDTAALYIGQKKHIEIAIPGNRNINSYFPSGWSAIAKKWDGLCSYTGTKGSGKSAMCNVRVNSHSWQDPSQYRAGFMCATKRDL